MQQSGNILVIKHGAFGDFIQSLGAFKAIREHHPNQDITLLTTKPYQSLAEQTGYFNDIWLDERPPLTQFKKWWALRQQIKQGQFSAVYDLQNTDRTGWYYYGQYPKPPQWSGFVRGCSHPHRTPHRGELHTLDRLQEQLELAGIVPIPAPSLDWMPEGEIEMPKKPFALLVTGGAAHRPDKRWPLEHYHDLAKYFVMQGVLPVLIGAKAEVETNDAIMAEVPDALNLTEKTSFFDINTLGQHAQCAVGNDTGAMHLLAVAGCTCVVLYGHASNPKRCGQRGKNVHILRDADITTISVEKVTETLNA